MRNELLYILENYLDAKKESLEQHSLGKYIRNTMSKAIIDLCNISTESYFIKGSPGMGNWAQVPWISVFDREISTKAKEGYYIVYLFAADMSGVYLSLNQGWTHYKSEYGKNKGKIYISYIADIWRRKLSPRFRRFTLDKIDLKSNEDLPVGYQLGHICGRFYPVDKIPTDEELKLDLYDMLQLLNMIKLSLPGCSYNAFNISAIVECNNPIISTQAEDNSPELAPLDNLIAAEAKDTFLSLVDTPDMLLQRNASHQPNEEQTGRSQDYLKKAKNQMKLGLAGEYMVIEYEREQLKRYGIFSKYVEHISREKGDSAGFDIKSYDENGNEKHIEVKTTTSGLNTPFYLSENEKNFSAKHANTYYLYRIYDFDPVKGEGKLYILDGNIEDRCKLSPTNYVVTDLNHTS